MIGEEGSTGHSTGTHLHIEVRGRQQAHQSQGVAPVRRTLPDHHNIEQQLDINKQFNVNVNQQQFDIDKLDYDLDEFHDNFNVNTRQPTAALLPGLPPWRVLHVFQLPSRAGRAVVLRLTRERPVRIAKAAGAIEEDTRPDKQRRARLRAVLRVMAAHRGQVSPH